jgi:hypothetical protein
VKCDHPEYMSWKGIKGRCLVRGDHNYRKYGAKGVTVCDRWRDSFENFLADMGPKPGPGYSVDRIDNKKGYEPGNCRWATHEEQNNNRGKFNRVVTAFGRTKTMSEWSRETGVKVGTIWWRLESGKTPEQSVAGPVVAEERQRRAACATVL